MKLRDENHFIYQSFLILSDLAMITVFAGVVVVLVLYLLFRNPARRSIVPVGLKELPSENGYPILGIIPKIESPLPIYLTKLVKKHGPVFTIRMGMRDVVVLNNFETMKKTLKENGEVYSGRSKMEFFSVLSHNSGILFIDGERLAKQRSFILTVLRDFGLGRARSQEIVHSECLYLLEELRKMDGESVDFSRLIPVYTANIISKFIMNKRFSREDPKLRLIEQRITDDLKDKDLVTLLHVMFPVFDKSRAFSKVILTLTSRMKKLKEVHDYFRDEIEEHRNRLDVTSEAEDLIDRFLIKQQELKDKTGNVDTFTDWQLIRSSFELFGAGYDTTSTTLGWSLLFMSRFPDIQEKVYQEIVDKIGDERIPTMNDRKSFHYSQAVMDEIMRLGSVTPLGINHRTLQDSSVNGYFIPKDSVILTNLFGSHIDPNTWENPMEFKPNRFLSVDNSGEARYCPREELIPFSLGKRQCIGESLARMEYFIFFISILQNFKVSFSITMDEDLYEEVLRGNDGFIRFSKVNDFIFSSRHQ